MHILALFLTLSQSIHGIHAPPQHRTHLVTKQTLETQLLQFNFVCAFGFFFVSFGSHSQFELTKLNKTMQKSESVVTATAAVAIPLMNMHIYFYGRDFAFSVRMWQIPF